MQKSNKRDLCTCDRKQNVMSRLQVAVLTVLLPELLFFLIKIITP